jgi:hypothetical protein
MAATCNSETSVDFQRTTRCYILEDSTLVLNESWESCQLLSVFFTPEEGMRQGHTYCGTADTQRSEGQTAADSGDEQGVDEQRMFQAVAVAFVQVLQLHGTGWRPVRTRGPWNCIQLLPGAPTHNGTVCLYKHCYVNCPFEVLPNAWWYSWATLSSGVINTERYIECWRGPAANLLNCTKAVQVTKTDQPLLLPKRRPIV